jgi:ribose/xylose/arabinose/galactoside ABC-type transport system permease subunit
MARFFPKSAVALLLVGGTAGAIVGACVAMAAQPNMQAALGSMQAARAELVRATPNKGGHRERALGFLDSAIGETKAGIAYAGP